MHEMSVAGPCANQCLDEEVVHLLSGSGAAAGITWAREALYLASLRDTRMYGRKEGKAEEWENRQSRYLQGARAGRPFEGAE